METTERIAGVLIRLERKRRAARVVVMWERLWRAFWPLASWIGGFVGLALMGAVTGLGPWLHLIWLFVALSGGVWLARRGSRAFRSPTDPEINRWLEVRNRIPHSPLTALDDLPAWGETDPAAQALWKAHMARVTTAVGQLHLQWPAPGVPALDPLGLRAVAVLLLAVGFGVSGGDSAQRLGAVLSPALLDFSHPVTGVQVWIDPPDYTALAQVTVTWRAKDAPKDNATQPPMPVTAGSRLTALIDGGADPSLMLGSQTFATTQLDDGSYRVEGTLAESGILTLTGDGPDRPLRALAVTPDQPPTVAFDKEPARTGGWRLGFTVTAADDFGLTHLSARLHPLYLPKGPPMEIPLNLPPGAPRAAQVNHILDMAAHTWAGQQIVISVRATDALGQSRETDPVTVVLPERTFTNPIARAVVAERRKLATGETTWSDTSMLLMGLAQDPLAFKNDRIVYLALETASLRLLRQDQTLALQDRIRDILWQTATRLEDGSMASAQRSMDNLEKALADAVAGDAGSKEIARLADALKEAIRGYMRELAREFGDAGLPPLATPPGTEVLTFQDMTNLLDMLRDLSAGGSKEAAQALMDRLKGLLQSLKEAPLNRPSKAAMDAAKQMMKELKDVSAQQEELLNRSFKRLQDQFNPNFQSVEHSDRRRADSAADAKTQQAVRDKLQSILRRLNFAGVERPEGLDNADENMGDAATALDAYQTDEAQQAQATAIENLRKGAQQAMSGMAQQLLSQGMMPFGSSAATTRDPLGRPAAGAFDDGSVKIPRRANVRRARQVLDTLRQRAADPTRPLDERDYLDRLLENF